MVFQTIVDFIRSCILFRYSMRPVFIAIIICVLIIVTPFSVMIRKRSRRRKWK